VIWPVIEVIENLAELGVTISHPEGGYFLRDKYLLILTRQEFYYRSIKLRLWKEIYFRSVAIFRTILHWASLI